jgi:predicted nucleotidyltransferase
MLNNFFKPNSLTSILIALANNSTTAFYLTGSQFFGNNTNESDYDLFVDFNHDLNGYLNSLGFKIVENSHDYTFCDLVELWERATVEGVKIQVQVLREGKSAVKHQAQTKIYSNRELFNKLDKQQRSKFWSMFL